MKMVPKYSSMGEKEGEERESWRIGVNDGRNSRREEGGLNPMLWFFPSYQGYCTSYYPNPLGGALGRCRIL